MTKILPFDEHVNEYEAWFKKHPFVFRSEVAAIRKLLPGRKKLQGIEVGVGTGRFAKALGIKDGIEPAGNMRTVAEQRGIFVLNAVAEALPYKSDLFDFVLMNFCICYFNDVLQAFHEAARVLKKDGVLIVGFIDKNSCIGKEYEGRKAGDIFYQPATFYTVENIIRKLKKAGFGKLEFSQTLFHPIRDIKSVEAARPGFGEGSYVLIKASKHW